MCPEFAAFMNVMERKPLKQLSKIIFSQGEICKSFKVFLTKKCKALVVVFFASQPAKFHKFQAAADAIVKKPKGILCFLDVLGSGLGQN